MLCVCEPPHEVLTLRVTPFDFSFVHCKPVVPIPRWAPNSFFASYTNSQSFVSQNCQFSFRDDGWSAVTPSGRGGIVSFQIYIYIYVHAGVVSINSQIGITKTQEKRSQNTFHSNQIQFYLVCVLRRSLFGQSDVNQIEKND